MLFLRVPYWQKAATQPPTLRTPPKVPPTVEVNTPEPPPVPHQHRFHPYPAGPPVQVAPCVPMFSPIAMPARPTTVARPTSVFKSAPTMAPWVAKTASTASPTPSAAPATPPKVLYYTLLFHRGAQNHPKTLKPLTLKPHPRRPGDGRPRRGRHSHARGAPIPSA